MFSPINLQLKPSLTYKYIRVAVGFIAVFALYMMSFPFGVKLLLLCILLSSFYVESRFSKPITDIHWDLNRSSLSLAYKGEERFHCQEILRLHSLPGLLWMIVRSESGGRHSIFIAFDSISKADYRRMKVALRFAKMTLNPSAIRN